MLTVKAARAARVQALRQTVAHGDYEIDPGRVADALVRRALFHAQLRAALQRSRARAVQSR
jgi:hypothetical protein